MKTILLITLLYHGGFGANSPEAKTAVESVEFNDPEACQAGLRHFLSMSKKMYPRSKWSVDLACLPKGGE